jgi:hypothetical protein
MIQAERGYTFGFWFEGLAEVIAFVVNGLGGLSHE